MKKGMIRGENLLISILAEKQLDEKFSYNMLKNLPLKAGLTPYADPQIYLFPNKQVDTEDGISGIMMMIESHCAFHWWRQNSYTNITISSCKPIKLVPVIEFLSEIFGTSSITWVQTGWPEME